MRDRIRVAPVFSELETDMPQRARDVEINAFRICFRHNDARTAMLVAQRLANDFIEQHISERVKLSQKSLEFIEGELDRLSTQIREIEAQIAQVKAENPGTLPEDVDGEPACASTASSRAWRPRAARSPRRRATRPSIAARARPRRRWGRRNDDASPARRLELLELALQQYQARGFTEKHPDVIAARVEMEAIEKKLVETSRRRTRRPSGASNFAAADAEAEARRAGAQGAGRRGGGRRASRSRPTRSRRCSARRRASPRSSTGSSASTSTCSRAIRTSATSSSRRRSRRTSSGASSASSSACSRPPSWRRSRPRPTAP